MLFNLILRLSNLDQKRMLQGLDCVKRSMMKSKKKTLASQEGEAAQ